jgi:hypothetical protein
VKTRSKTGFSSASVVSIAGYANRQFRTKRQTGRIRQHGIETAIIAHFSRLLIVRERIPHDGDVPPGAEPGSARSNTATTRGELPLVSARMRAVFGKVTCRKSMWSHVMPLARRRRQTPATRGRCRGSRRRLTASATSAPSSAGSLSSARSLVVKTTLCRAERSRQAPRDGEQPAACHALGRNPDTQRSMRANG